MIVPQLYYVPESELLDEGTASIGSVATARDMSYTLEVRRDPIPFLWAQSLFYTAKLLRESGEHTKNIVVESCIKEGFKILMPAPAKA